MQLAVSLVGLVTEPIRPEIAPGVSWCTLKRTRHRHDRKKLAALFFTAITFLLATVRLILTGKYSFTC